MQGVLEDALAVVFREPVPTTVAGRTDAGVHASSQVVSCAVPSGAPMLDDLPRLRAALDHLCGPDVAIWRVRRVPASFDARFSATQRRYRYRLCDADAMDPTWRTTTWHAGLPRLDVDAMHAAGQHLVGERVFASFCRKRDGDALVRRLDRVAVRRMAGPLVVVAVDGAAFCHQMVRSIVGSLVDVGTGRRAPDWIAAALEAEDRAAAGPVAPPHGLSLVGVRYGRSGAKTRGAAGVASAVPNAQPPDSRR